MFKNKKSLWAVLLVIFSSLLTLFPYFSEPVKAYHDAPTGASTNDSGETVIVTFPDETVTFGDTDTAPLGVYKGVIDGNPCQSYLELDSSNGTAVLTVRDGDGTSCQAHETHALTVSGETPDPDDGEAEEEDFTPTCNSEGGELAWMACPLLIGMLNGAEAMANFMGSLLRVRPITTASDDPVFQVWQGTRNIALALLVIGALIAIFSEALSINSNAYAVRKMLPRLGVVAIGIMLSYHIAALLIDFFNVLGGGMLALISSVTADLEITVETLPAVLAQIFAVGLAGGALALFLSPGILAGLVLILMPVVLALLTALVVVTLRHVLIIALVIAAPIAIAGWLLPNTEWSFKRWYKFFGTLLMMYPIIMVLLGSSVIFAYVVTGGAVTGNEELSESTFVNYLLALLGVGGVMFLVPFTIKSSSGFLGRVAGMVNDPNRGMFDRIRGRARDARDKSKELKRQDQAHAVREGRFPGRNKFSRGMRRGAWTAAHKYNTYAGGYTGENRAEVEGQALSSGQREQLADYRGRKTQLEAGNMPIRMRELEDSQRNFEIDAVVKGHERNITSPGELVATAEDANANPIERIGATTRLSQIQDRNGLTQALAGMADSGDLRLAQETVSRNFGDINTIAPELTGYVTGQDGVDFSRFDRKQPHQIGAVSPDSIEALTREAEPSQIKNVVQSYVEADAKNQPTNYQAAGHLYNYARSNPDQFSTEEINTLQRISRQTGGGSNTQPPGPSGPTPPSPSSPGGGPSGAPSGGGGPITPSSGGAGTAESAPRRVSFDQFEQEVVQRAKSEGIPTNTIKTPQQVIETARGMNMQVPTEVVEEIEPSVSTPTTLTRRVTGQQIKNMGVDNVTEYVNSNDGVQNIHEGELLSIANQYGTADIGKQARSELNRRGVTAPRQGSRIVESEVSTDTQAVESQGLVRKSSSGGTTTVTPIDKPFEDGGKQVVKARYEDKIIDVPVEELYESQESTSPVAPERINTAVFGLQDSSPGAPTPYTPSGDTPAERAESIRSRPKPSLPGSEEIRNRPSMSESSAAADISSNKPTEPAESIRSRPKPSLPGSEEIRNRPSSYDPSAQQPSQTQTESEAPENKPGTGNEESSRPNTLLRKEGYEIAGDLSKDVPETRPDEDTPETNTGNDKPSQPNPFLREDTPSPSSDFSQDTPPPEESDAKPGDVIGPDEDNEENN